MLLWENDIVQMMCAGGFMFSTWLSSCKVIGPNSGVSSWWMGVQLGVHILFFPQQSLMISHYLSNSSKHVNGFISILFIAIKNSKFVHANWMTFVTLQYTTYCKSNQ